MRRCVIGLERDGTLEALHRLDVPMEVAQRVAAVVMGFCVVRLQRQRAIEARQGLGMALEIPQHDPTVVERLRVLGLLRDRAIEARERLLAASEIAQQIAQIVVRARISRPQRYRPLVALQRLCRARETGEGYPAIVVGFRAAGVERNRALIALQCLGRAIETPEHDATIEVRVGVIGSQRNGPLVAFERLGETLELAQRDAAVEARVGASGLTAKALASRSTASCGLPACPAMTPRRYSASKCAPLASSTCRQRCSASRKSPRWIAATARCIACGTVNSSHRARRRHQSRRRSSRSINSAGRTLSHSLRKASRKAGSSCTSLERRPRNDAAFLRVLAGELGRGGRPDARGAAHPGEEGIDVARGEASKILVVADPDIVVARQAVQPDDQCAQQRRDAGGIRHRGRQPAHRCRPVGGVAQDEDHVGRAEGAGNQQRRMIAFGA